MPNAPYTKKPFLVAPDGTVGEGAQMEAQFGMFGDNANHDAR